MMVEVKMSAKTPKKNRSGHDSKDSNSLQGFSPVAVSPGRSPLQGNLTGTPRKVKDTCADWYNSIQKWQALNIKGLSVATDIANIKLAALQEGEANASNIPPETEKHCVDLTAIYQSMKKIVKKMTTLTEVLDGVCQLELHQFNQSFNQDPLFQTWTTHRFALTSQELLRMYQEELSLKETIIQNIAHAPDRNTIMFYTAAWLHQPFICEESEFLLESMLKETGHR